MKTIPDIIKNKLRKHPYLHDMLSKDIANFSKLAEHLQQEISQEYGENVSSSAIMMALRRIAFKLENKKLPPNKVFNSEIILKSGLCDLTVLKTPSLVNKLKTVYDIVDQVKGETLNIIHGNYEVTIVITEKHLDKLKKLLEKEEILNIEKNLVSLAMSFSKDFLYTPGMLSLATRELAWENLNVYENISTMTELIFIVSGKDATRAYTTLKKLTEDT
jgi:aspartokinase